MSDSPEPAEPSAATSVAAIPATLGATDARPPEDYNPDEYRWVPVRRVPRRDGWTEEKQRRFIETLADTGQVSLAVKAVGLSRESAYKLRRQPYATAFARAWDAARHHAGSLLEDVAFERAVDGEERPVFNEYGEVIATKRVVNDRLLMFLLRHLKPERYAADALARPAPPPVPVEIALRAMEPQLPAPPEQLLTPDDFETELDIANICDGALPSNLHEQRPAKTAEQRKREEWARQEERGRATLDKEGPLTAQEFAAQCRYLDPAGRGEPPRKRYR
jgi:hypothetical protein